MKRRSRTSNLITSGNTSLPRLSENRSAVLFSTTAPSSGPEREGDMKRYRNRIPGTGSETGISSDSLAAVFRALTEQQRQIAELQSSVEALRTTLAALHTIRRRQ